jgi:hypothetical protein
MSRTIRFHLDENVSNAVASGLRRYSIDVTTTSQAGLIGKDDPNQIQFAKTEGRVIVTHDPDFLRLHYTDASHSGIAYCAKDERSVGEIIQGLVLIWEVLDPADMEGQVEFL